MTQLPGLRNLLPPTKGKDHPGQFIVRIVVYLAVAFLGFFLLIRLVPGAAAPAVVSTAWLSTQLLRLFGVSATLNGITVEMERFHFTIIYECTAVYSSLIFVSCILAYPARTLKKVIGIAWGIPAMVAINTVRVVVLAWVGENHMEYFDLLHGYLWQVTIILVVVALWVLWLMGAAKDG